MSGLFFSRGMISRRKSDLIRLVKSWRALLLPRCLTMLSWEKYFAIESRSLILAIPSTTDCGSMAPKVMSPTQSSSLS